MVAEVELVHRHKLEDPLGILLHTHLVAYHHKVLVSNCKEEKTAYDALIELVEEVGFGDACAIAMRIATLVVVAYHVAEYHGQAVKHYAADTDSLVPAVAQLEGGHAPFALEVAEEHKMDHHHIVIQSNQILYILTRLLDQRKILPRHKHSHPFLCYLLGERALFMCCLKFVDCRLEKRSQSIF